jgi:hypothetical protein
MPTTVLQGFHIDVAQEIRFHMDSSSTKLVKIVVEKTKLQQEYNYFTREEHN